jgi:hypothetical protein
VPLADVNAVAKQTDRPSHETSNPVRGELGGHSLTEGGATIKDGSEAPVAEEPLPAGTLTAEELG